MLKLPINAQEYYLVQPEKFERREVIIHKLPKDYTVIKPLYTAICGSDVQYYYGEKTKEKLATRLPLILLHEGICLDLVSKSKVVPLAGDFRKVPPEYKNRENTWPDLPYLGATLHGLARSHMLYPKSLLIQVPQNTPDTVATLTEPLSIAIKCIREMSIQKKDVVAIIGTGGMAYLVILVLIYLFNIPKKNIYVLGVNDDKLAIFHTLCNVFNYSNKDLSKLHQRFTIVFEAVGGQHLNITLNAAFSIIKPAGKIGIIGISDLPVNIPFNQLVNQKITVNGLTRSTPKDYEEAIDLLQQTPIIDLIEQNLINPNIYTIKSAEDLQNAFDFTNSSRAVGRILLKW